MNNSKPLIRLVFAVMIFCVTTSHASAPQLTSYQGVISDGGGPLNGTFQLVFTIYDAQTAGTVIWQETHSSVTMTDGRCNAILGQGDHTTFGPLQESIFDDTLRWLGITVGTYGSDPEVSPRTRLTTVPYAFHVASIDSADGGHINGDVDILGRLKIGTTAVDSYEFPDLRGLDGQIIKTDGSGNLFWDIPNWIRSGNWVSTYSFDDSVGVGISNPQSKFHVRGKILSDVYEALPYETMAIYGDAHNTDDLGSAIGVYGIGTNQSQGGGAYGGLFVSVANAVENGARYGVLGRAYGRASASVVGAYEYGVRGEATGYESSNTFGVYGTAHQYSSGNAWGGQFYAYANGTGPAYGISSRAFSSPGGDSYGALLVGVSANSTAAYGCQVQGINSAGGPSYGGYFSADTAGLFSGHVKIMGTLSKSAGSFMIDHPLDPANKYLFHSFIESPDMKNVYDGVAELDASGQALVTLPDYFEALNSDFRYQLTCIGGYAPVYIASEVSDNQFVIAGGESGMKVSWQVTGIRKDAYAAANRIQVEVDKSVSDRGHYLHPKAFGYGDDKGVEYERIQRAKAPVEAAQEAQK